MTVEKKNKRGTNPDSLKNIEPHKWKPGESGNPAGKPPGIRNYSTVIRDVLDQVMIAGEEHDDDSTLIKKLEESLGRKVTRRELMVYKQTLLAMQGNTYAFNSLADREEGRPTQKIEAEVEANVSSDVRVQKMDLEDRLKQLKGEK
jgi:hypothetical protein